MAPADLLRDWQLLGRSLELGEGFSYYLVFTNWPEQNQEGRALLNDALQARGLSLQVVVPDDPEKLVETAVAALFRDDLPPATPLWLECWRNGSDPAWNLARRRLMARLNEGRGRLEKEVLRPLILLLPRDGVLRAAEDAPDMWSIRKLVVHLERPAELGVPIQSLELPKFVEPPTPENLARSERKLVAWQKQWARAEALGDMHVLSLPDAGDACDALLEAGRLQEAKTVAERALAASRVRRDDSQPNTLRDLSVSLSKVGEVAHNLGDLESAHAAYTESLEIRRQLRSAFGDTPLVLRDLSVSLMNIGNVARDMGDLELAQAVYAESLESFRQLRVALGETPEVLRDLSISLNKVGELARDQGDLETYRRAYAESLGLRRRLREVSGDTPENLEVLVWGLGLWGHMQTVLQDPAAARAAFQEAADLAARLVALRPEHPGYRKLQAQIQADLEKLPP